MFARAWTRLAWIEHFDSLLKGLLSKMHAAPIAMNGIKKARMCSTAGEIRLVWVDLEVCTNYWVIVNFFQIVPRIAYAMSDNTSQ